jgi:anti-anti-sigma regulatory factor
MKNKSYNIKISEDKVLKSHTVTMEGDLGLKNAIALKQTFQMQKFKHDTVLFQLKNVEKLDITTIQTLRAIRLALNKTGKKTQMQADLTPEVERLLKNTGFDNTL